MSHAHADRDLVGRLYELPTEKAGLSIWYDAYETGGGDSICTTLQRGVEQSRGILLVAKLRGFEHCDAPKLYRHFVRASGIVEVRGQHINRHLPAACS